MSQPIALRIDHTKDSLIDALHANKEKVDRVVIRALTYDRISKALETIWMDDGLTMEEKILATYLYGRIMGECSPIVVKM